MNIRSINNYAVQRPAKRRRSKKPSIIVFLLFVSGVLFLQFTNSDTTTDQSSQAAVSGVTTTTEPAIDAPSSVLANIVLPEFGMSAVGTLEQGTIKTSSTDQVPVPIASVTKTITTLVLLDKSPLQKGDTGPAITFTLKDEQYYQNYLATDGTISPVTAGLSMSKYDILQAILLASSNNLSDTLVDYYFPNREDYYTYAAEYLARNGINNTTVADASGFSPNSKSTPSDLIKIGQLLLKNEVLREIVAKPNAEIAISGKIPNYNVLIEEPNVIGIKPGLTDEAGYCLLFAAEFPKPDGGIETVIAVTLGHQDRSTYVQSALKILNDSRTLVTSPASM